MTSAPVLCLNDRLRLGLVRVAARLHAREDARARRLARLIRRRLDAVPAHAARFGARYGQGHPWKIEGRSFRATPAFIAYMKETMLLFHLNAHVGRALDADPDLAALKSLLA